MPQALASKSYLSVFTRWTNLSGRVAIAQIFIQGVNAITGLVLVRLMAKEDYAWLTVAASLLATLNLLADGGVSTGLTVIGGQLHDQKTLFARLLTDALGLSFKLCTFGFLLATPFFWTIFENVGAPHSIKLGVMVLAFVSSYSAISTALYGVANRLQKRVQFVQGAEATAAITRLALILGVAGFGDLSVLPTLAATVFSIWVQGVFIRSQSRELIGHLQTQTSYGPELKGFIKSLYANHVFFCLQAQFTTWIIGWLAGSGEVADLGALARLGLLFTAISAPFTQLAIPAVARIREPRTLRIRLATVFVVAVSATVSIICVSWLFPTPFLWLLGDKYRHLGSELPLAIIGQGITMVAGLAWSLALARGWVKRAWMTIFTTSLGFVIAGLVAPLNTVTGVLQFNIVAIIPTFLYCAIVICIQTFRTQEASTHS